MLQITLICAGGMSTSMLVAKMQKSAKDKGIETEIRATAEGKFKKEYSDKTDVLLLGPQVGFMLNDFKKEYEPKGMKVDVIDSIDYGMMNGEKVLNKALSL
ncbi:PTS sugar transporter subunit IIB [Clostridium fungisolvens]|uniref:PTS system cellobiose-specific EIIB component n=1 Tax=Clostridium fungisolvens TaxID=1604897 RepID=A0A6V8SDP1_9CLOT|nr:PTS sugar transporter subunit IIB [Clostridium fungisolvens]GFP74672.1 PTS system cellobiose-specific EIIB component [Clostridium fungisolvens]